jgi:hypothetical protein
MHVYQLRADANHFQNLILADESIWDQMQDMFNGTPVGMSWSPLRVEVLRDEDQNRALPPGDFPSLMTRLPVFSQRAVDTLSDLLHANGEFLPLVCSEGTYFAFNVTRVIDALDVQRSEVKRFSDGRIMRVVRYEFVPDILEGLSIFKIPETARMEVFVTDPFVSRVQSAGLVGFDFKLVWSAPTP